MAREKYFTVETKDGQVLSEHTTQAEADAEADRVQAAMDRGEGYGSTTGEGR